MSSPTLFPESWRLSVAELGRIAAVSPHLDDAAMGCGALLSCATNAIVITVFAGKPPAHTPLTEWDARCGFKSSEQGMATRLAEDGQAMRGLGCTPIRLDFLDVQYGTPPPVAEVARSIERLLLLHHINTVFIPIGLFHTDHRLVNQACLDVRDDHGSLRWLAYEDFLYRRKPGLLQQRLAKLQQREVAATPVEIDCERGVAAKAQAILAYASQRPQLGLDRDPGDTATPERYWILHEPDAA